ncbi:hypothetical protein G9A89_004165 [Geosiphon pyriformis]|nr:hypothetical protein G9A89_004165 [Geosiphon pyriformis]
MKPIGLTIELTKSESLANFNSKEINQDENTELSDIILEKEIIPTKKEETETFYNLKPDNLNFGIENNADF